MKILQEKCFIKGKSVNKSRIRVFDKRLKNDQYRRKKQDGKNTERKPKDRSEKPIGSIQDRKLCNQIKNFDEKLNNKKDGYDNQNH